MKKEFKIIGIIAALISIALFIFIVYGVIRLKKEGSTLKPIETQMIMKGIYTVKTDFGNFYIMTTSDGYIVFDAGSNSKKAQDGMRLLNIDAEKVKAVFLTHTDADHIAAVKLFKNAKVYISTEEEKLLNGKVKRVMIFGNSLNIPHLLLKNGEKLKIGETEIVGFIEPGHTVGSMIYIVDNKYLFTGDVLSLNEEKAYVFNDFFNMDTKVDMESIKRISMINNFEYIFTAHYGYTKRMTDTFEKINGGEKK